MDSCPCCVQATVSTELLVVTGGVPGKDAPKQSREVEQIRVLSVSECSERNEAETRAHVRGERERDGEG